MEPLDQLTPKTIQVLQPLFPKPKLNDKLLSKPPFRFLHDIITAVSESTGFTKGLFTPEELDTEAIKENKQAKLNFLTKAIDIVCIASGQTIDCKATKIVAGAEPENTNVWLQALAKVAADSDTDNEEAVRRTLAGVKPGELPLPKKSLRGSAAPPTSEAKQTDDSAAREEKERKQKHDQEKQEQEEKARTDALKRAEEKAAAESKATAEAASAKRLEQDEKEAKARRAEEDERTAKAASAVAAPPIAESKTVADDSTQPKATESATAKTGGGLRSQIEECNGDITRTQETLGKLVSTPKLTEKLLGKPPFRFLQDIVSEVTRATGFASGLYTDAELESANKDKDTKVAYLTKIIRCVGIHLGVQVEAKPAKVVAGLESDKTNAFLQLLAVAAKSGNSDATVQATLRGEEGSTTDVAKPLIRQDSASSKAVDTSQPKEISSSRPSSGSSTAKAEVKGPPKADLDGAKASAKQESAKPTSDQPPASSLPPASPRQGDDEPMVAPSTSRKTARPTTARRKPPKLKENVREVDRPTAAEAKVAAPSHIMKEGANSDSEGEGSDNEGPTGKPAQITAIDGEKHGKLVRNILSESKQTAEESKKEEEDKKAEAAGIRLGRLKKTAEKLGVANTGTFTQEQIDNLRRSIQKLCQASNPLGKCMDYVHDDVETMVKELSFWRAEYSKDLVLLEKEQKLTEESTHHTKLQIVELTEQVKEQVGKINALKASIAKNDARIQQLLRMVISG